ncbi:hypothetical protein ANO11243_056380 [Dothideomycetidae sp. 11243]|nr:hypothetical protein ANO11243_056380 [fungal sp. No.11243]
MDTRGESFRPSEQLRKSHSDRIAQDIWNNIPNHRGWSDFNESDIRSMLPAPRSRLSRIPGKSACQYLQKIACRYSMKKARKLFKERLGRSVKRRLNVKELMEISGWVRKIPRPSSIPKIGSSGRRTISVSPLYDVAAENGAVGSLVDATEPGNTTTLSSAPRVKPMLDAVHNNDNDDYLLHVARVALDVDNQQLQFTRADRNSPIRLYSADDWNSANISFPNLSELSCKMDRTPTGNYFGSKLRHWKGSEFRVSRRDLFQNLLADFSSGIAKNRRAFPDVKKTNIFDIEVETLMEKALMDTFEALAWKLVTAEHAREGCLNHMAALMHAGTCTSVHHDNNTSVALAHSRPDTRSGQPLKLWLFTSANYISTLYKHYGNTGDFFQAVVAAKGKVEFLIQYDNDLVVIPSNCPHAVYTFQDCYIHGPSWDNPSQTRFLGAEAKGDGAGVDEVNYSKYVDKVERDLHGPHNRAIATQICNFAEDDKEFHQHWGHLRLVKILATKLRQKDGECLVCEEIYEPGGWESHVRDHLNIEVRPSSQGSQSGRSNSGRVLRISRTSLPLGFKR